MINFPTTPETCMKATLGISSRTVFTIVKVTIAIDMEKKSQLLRFITEKLKSNLNSEVMFVHVFQEYSEKFSA